MYTFLHDLLADKKDGEIFVLFGAWHFLYIVLALVTVLSVLWLLKNKSAETRNKVRRAFVCVAFGLYIADFFMMPLAHGFINIEKLPFHACTTMCVLCFLSEFVPFMKKFRLSFVLLGLISNFVYLIYPAGVMWFEIHPLSYRVIQTLLFHAVMAVYGTLTLILERDQIHMKTWWRDLAVIVGLTLWALLGNYAYNGDSEGYSHFFNWFFVVRDPFNMFPERIAPFIMPFLNILLFFAAEMLLHSILWYVQRVKKENVY